MEKLEKLYEGKAKQLYATDDPEVLWVEYKNSATAGDGEKKEDFAGKGRLNNLITTLIFDLLKKRGIDSHSGQARVGDTAQLVQEGHHVPARDRAAQHRRRPLLLSRWAWRRASRSRSRCWSTS